MKKVLLSFASILVAVGAMAQLSGTYTINGAQATGGTNYQTFSAAFSALTSNGVSGPVTFNVMSGTYNEQVTLSGQSISGSSTTNTITFQSDASNSTMPVWSANSYCIYANSSSTNLNNITFDGLEFNASSNHTLYFYNGSYTNLLFENCYFENSTTNYNHVYLRGTANNVTFDNNEMKGADYAIYGYYLTGGSTVNVTNNHIYDWYYSAVYTGYTYYTPYPTWTITGNQIESADNIYSYPRALYLYYVGPGTKATHNEINLNGSSGGYGIYAYRITPTSTNKALIANNMINFTDATDAGTQYGMYLNYSSYTDVVNNSIRTSNNSTSSRCIYAYYYSGTYPGNTIVNNVLYGQNGYNFYFYGYNNSLSNVFSSIDYNDYYLAGTEGMYNYSYTSSGTVSATSLSAWQSGTTMDSNSLVADPLYMSSTDLHSASNDINNMGTPLAIVTDDIDGESRSATTPDIGADEFIVPNNNAQPGDLLAPDAPLCDDDTTINIVLYNSGLVALTSCSLNYSINGGTPVSMAWTGSLSPQTQDTVLVESSINFTSGDTLSVWTSSPNGVLDSAAANDTVWLVLNNGLSGTFAIPGDYATLTDARDDLVLKGVCDDVVFNLASGSYNEQVEFPDIEGTSEDATITFQSATGNMNDVSINYDPSSTGDNFVVKMSGGDWITFKNVKIHNLDASNYSVVLNLSSGSDNNTFDNCWIKSNGYNYTYYLYRAAILMNGQVNGLTLNENRVEGGSHSLYMYGGSTSSPSQDLTMTDNMFEDANYYGMYMYAVDGLEMHGNTLTNDSAFYYNNYAYYGVYMYATNNFNITGNYIGSNQDNGYRYAFYMNNCIGTNNPRSQFANNCIFGGADGSTSYGYYAFYAYNSGIMDFHHNSITRQGGYSGGYYAAYFNGGGLISVKNNSIANMISGGYALGAPGGFSISESDHNNLYVSSGSLVYYGSAAYNTLEDYQNASGFDMNSVVTDPNWETALTCITCNDTLSNAGDVSSQVTTDIQGNARSVIASDIGAVEFVSPASFSLGEDDTICGDQFIVEAGPAQSVTWNVNNQTSTDPSVTLNANGQAETFTISVNITTEYCGSGSDNVVLRLIPDASLDSSMHLCADETAVLDPGGAANADYLWNTGETAASITIADAGSYSVTKMEEGCESSAWIDVTQSDAVQLVDQDACSDDLPLSVDATIANGTSYAWSGGSSLTTAVNELSDAGSYSVTATDSYGCTSSAEFDLTVLEEPEANISETHSGSAYFFDGTSSLYVSANTEYFWDLGYNGITDSTSNPTIVYPWSDPSNPVTYTVTLTIDNGCGVDVTTMEVTPDPVGIEDIAANGFELYPNPAQEMVNFVLGSAVSQAGTIQVMDVTGRVLNSQVLAAGQTKGEINLNGLAAGSYMVKLTIDGHSTVNTLVKQ